MGTNYYVRDKNCPFCGRYETIHLGKSSIGWKFLFQANNFVYYSSWSEMKEWLKDKTIKDEYEEKVELEEFTKLIETKHKDPTNWNHQRNDAQNIPEGFVTVDSEGHEFHNGEFS